MENPMADKNDDGVVPDDIIMSVVTLSSTMAAISLAFIGFTWPPIDIWREGIVFVVACAAFCGIYSAGAALDYKLDILLIGAKCRSTMVHMSFLAFAVCYSLIAGAIIYIAIEVFPFGAYMFPVEELPAEKRNIFKAFTGIVVTCFIFAKMMTKDFKIWFWVIVVYSVPLAVVVQSIISTL